MFDAALIHLSDIECGDWNRGQSLSYRDGYALADEQLLKDVEVILRDNQIKAGRVGLVLTGDITDKAETTEYARAEATVQRIREKFRIPAKYVAIVPGNHDVSWRDCQDAFEAAHRGLKKPDAATRRDARLYPAKLANFNHFCELVMEGRYGDPEQAREFQGFLELGVALVGFDTTVPCTFVRPDNYGLLRGEQIRQGGILLAGLVSSSPNAFRIAAMHHSPFPAADRDNKDKSLLRNATEARGWLSEEKFRITLSGHEHVRATILEPTEGMQHFQAGSYGINGAKLSERYEYDRTNATNGYEVFLLGPSDSGRVLFRRLPYDHAGRADGSWEDAGEYSVAREIPAARAAVVTVVPGRPARFVTRPDQLVVSISLDGPEPARRSIEEVTYRLSKTEILVKKAKVRNRAAYTSSFSAQLVASMAPGDSPKVSAVLHRATGDEQLGPLPLPDEDPKWSVGS